jgi:hypothetical protein
MCRIYIPHGGGSEVRTTLKKNRSKLNIALLIVCKWIRYDYEIFVTLLSTHHA